MNEPIERDVVDANSGDIRSATMGAERSRFSLVRLAALLAVLLCETALTVSLWYSGWWGTGSYLLMIACGAAALLPLIVAAALIFGNRFRFSMRSLLVAMALVALFMFFSVRPLLEARNARQASRQLVSHGVQLELESSNERFLELYTTLDYDPRPARSYSRPVGDIPGWLTPLAGDLPNLPRDDAVLSAGVETDAQLLALCQMAPRLRNLESIAVWGQVSPAGLARLQTTVPQFKRLVHLQLSVAAPVGFLKSLTNIRTLFVWREPPTQVHWLTSAHLQEIAELPRLEVLMFLGFGNLNDASVKPLTRSTSLKHLLLRITSISSAGQQQLSEAMPNCKIRFW